MPQIDLPTINFHMARLDAISQQISTISDKARSENRFVTPEEKELCDGLALEHTRIKKELGIGFKGNFGHKYPKTADAKYCPKCKRMKRLDDFYETQGKIGSHCKTCEAKYNKEWAKNNREHQRETQKKYWAIPENRERRNARARKHYQENYPKYREKQQKYNKDWKRRYYKTVRGKIDNRMSTGIRDELKRNKNGVTWKNLVPYSLDQLQRHLKKTMPPGYSWEDFLSGGLHIDHKTPLSFFSYSSPNDLAFLKAWSLKNLQLLPAEVNMEKGATLESPTQQLFPFNTSKTR